MSKPVKELMIKEISARFSKLDSVLVVNPIALNAIDNTTVRGALRKKKIEMEVVRNSLAVRALKGTKLENIGELLIGASAIVSGGESIVDVAREVSEIVRKMPKLEVRGALVEGEVLDSQGAEQLAKMPSRTELQGQVALLANSPAKRLAGAITSPAAKIAGCIKALEEKLEKEGGSVAAA
ncbi:MAG: 50S ribosomal protein L10 [Phycisphaerae bacterium]|jgi:large subunit ribosomal protein L10|nr:50S ribosomal protein L10 [Phycisphaerae bacterium]